MQIELCGYGSTLHFSTYEPTYLVIVHGTFHIGEGSISTHEQYFKIRTHHIRQKVIRLIASLFRNAYPDTMIHFGAVYEDSYITLVHSKEPTKDRFMQAVYMIMEMPDALLADLESAIWETTKIAAEAEEVTRLQQADAAKTLSKILDIVESYALLHSV